MKDDEGERQFMDDAGELEKMYKEPVGTLGDEHPDTLSIMKDIAVTYNHVGWTQKAHKLFENYCRGR